MEERNSIAEAPKQEKAKNVKEAVAECRAHSGQSGKEGRPKSDSQEAWDTAGKVRELYSVGQGHKLAIS